MAAKNNSYSIEGVLHTKFDTQKFDTKKGTPFYIRRFILEVEERTDTKIFTQIPEFTVTGDTTSVLDDILPRTKIQVMFSLQGRYIEYLDKEGNKKTFHKTEAKAFGIKVLEVPTEQREAMLDDAFSGPSASVDPADLPF